MTVRSDTPTAGIDIPGASLQSTSRTLRWAATFFAVAVVIHNLDHVRRGVDNVSSDVFVVGSAAVIVEVGLVWLVIARHRWGPLAAAVFGLTLAAGYALVHFTPSRSWLSDSFVTGAPGVNAFSWFAAGFETAAGVTLGTIGLKQLRRAGGLVGTSSRTGTDAADWLGALTHPAVSLMLAASVVGYVISFSQL